MRADVPLRLADERILTYLQEHPPDYIPLIANRLGMHLGYVEDRRDVLLEYGLIEPVTNERIYGLSDRGEQYLRGDLEAATLRPVAED